MINLLPYDYKQDLAYARKNFLLIKWLVALVVAMIFILAISLGGAFVINNQRGNAEESAKTEADAIMLSDEKQEFDKYKKFKADYDTVVKLLSKQLRYSKIIQDIGNILPEGTNIDGIKLTPGATSLTLSVNGKSQQAIREAFVKISDKQSPIKLFPKADLESITCSDSPAGDSSKACTASIKVLLNADSNYYYINAIPKAGN